VTPRQAEDDDNGRGRCDADTGDDPHQPANLALQRRAFRFDGAQRRADAAEFGSGTRPLYQPDPVTLHHQGAGEHPRGCVTAGPAHRRFGCRRCGARERFRAGRGLADRNRFAGKRRLVNRQVHAIHQLGVCGNPVTLGEQHHVAAHDIAPGDTHLPPVAHHQRPRGGQITQRGQRVLGLVLLVDRDGDDDDHERHQNDAVQRLRQQEVDGPGTEQQHQHRLAYNIPRLLRQVALLGGRQFVRPIRG
jgi:hypothetical protein